MASENYLLLSKTFALNKSCTKHISVGLSMVKNYETVFQLYGMQRYHTIEFSLLD